MKKDDGIKTSFAGADTGVLVNPSKQSSVARTCTNLTLSVAPYRAAAAPNALVVKGII